MPDEAGIVGDLTQTTLDEPIDITTDTGNDVIVEEPVGIEEAGEQPEHPEGEQPEGGREAEEPAAPKIEPKEIMPAALAKAVRELRQAHPEAAPALKELNNAYYRDRAYRQVYSTPEEARTDKAAIEALGGQDGIASMRADVDSIRQFDQMASEGNPRVIEGLAEEFPDGFKRLVPTALDRLSRMDGDAYRETMRGPLLQMLDGDGLIGAISQAMEYIKVGLTKPENLQFYVENANRSLSQIAQWYNALVQQEKDFRGRWQDPKVKQLETERERLNSDKANFIRENVRRDLDTYLSATMRPEVSKLVAGKTISEATRTLFNENVTRQIYADLGGNAHYRDTMKNLMSQGNVEAAVRFAKPYIDNARKSAIAKVATAMNITGLPLAKRSTQPSTQQRATETNNNVRTASNNSKPVPINRKPAHDDIDWNRTKDLDYIQGRAYLTSGRFVTWRNA